MNNKNNTSRSNAEPGRLYPAYKSIVEFARARGCVAETTEGARRFLLNRHPPALAGLIHLNHPAWWRTSRRPEVSPLGWNNHAARVAAFVRCVAAACSPCPAWGEYLASVHHPLTADSVTALEEKTYRVWLELTKAKLEHMKPYRRAQSDAYYAGGIHFITLQLGEIPAAFGGSQRGWGRGGQWSGLASYNDFTVTRRCLQATRGELLVANLLTVDCELLGLREYRATWVEQGRGFSLKLVTGFIIRGQHVRAATLAHARKKAQREREKQAQALLERRLKRRALAAEGPAITDGISVAVPDSFPAAG